jgi:DNA replication licensing factor MCM6
MAVSSDAGLMMSDGFGRTAATPRRRPGQPSSSTGRPRAPPSESLGAPSDDEGEGFADDQVPVRSRPTDAATIPRVEDKIGLLIQEHFENFLEGYGSRTRSLRNGNS